MLKRKIAIIGASYLQQPLVEKAQAMGLETHCFAWEEGAVCKEIADFFYPISILEKELILEKCIQIKINGITSIASDAAVPTVCYVAENLGLISNLYVDSFAMTNKYEMRKRFHLHKVSSPKFAATTEINDFEDFQYPLIVKPTDRSGSRGVEKVKSAYSLENAIERAKKESFSNQVIVEEFIDGVEVSVETISWNGEHYILTITDKVTTGEPYFVELEHHQPSMLNYGVILDIRKETIKALNALNIKFGASHAEFKISSNGDVYIIEVGARMGGDFIGSDLVKLSTGYDFVQGIVEVALGKFEPPTFIDNSYSGIYFLCKETEHLQDYFHNATLYKEIVSSEIFNENLLLVQNSADRSGYLIYQSNKKWDINKKR
ncbi:MAG: ATP-grasp domain-containing protein [Bacteroidales bacterium]|nr:ATP-grasp domain-containing protein [Bacteroidales bacterium]